MPPTCLHLRIGELTVGLSTWGLFLGLAGLVAVVLVVRLARPAGTTSAIVACFWAIVVGLLSARFAAMVLGGERHGLLFPLHAPAGIAAALAAAAVAWRLRGVDPWRGLDWLAPGLAAGHAVVALGCFAAGCCFGAPAAPGLPGLMLSRASVAWQTLSAQGVVPLAAPSTPPLVPVPLGETALWGALALLLAWAARRGAAGRGLLLGAYLVVAGALPWLAESWRWQPAPLAVRLGAAALAVAGLATTLAGYARRPAHDPPRLGRLSDLR